MKHLSIPCTNAEGIHLSYPDVLTRADLDLAASILSAWIGAQISVIEGAGRKAAESSTNIVDAIDCVLSERAANEEAAP